MTQSAPLRARVYLASDLAEAEWSLPPIVDIDPGALEDDQIYAHKGPPTRDPKSRKVTWNTAPHRVVARRRVWEEDHGFVWHIVAEPGKVELTAWAKANAYAGSPRHHGKVMALFGAVLMIVTAGVVYLQQYLVDPLSIGGFIVFHLERLLLLGTLLATILYMISAFVQDANLRGFGIGLIGFSIAFMTPVFAGYFATPDAVPGTGDYTYADYLIDFIALQSTALNDLAPVMPLVAFALQLAGLKALDKLLGGTAKLSQKDGPFFKG